MRKIFILMILIFAASLSGLGQNKCDFNQSAIDAACFTLADLMDCHLKKKKYTQALAVLLLYRHVKDDYNVPEQARKYFRNITETDLKELSRIRLSLKGASTGSEKKSSMPDEIVIRH